VNVLFLLESASKSGCKGVFVLSPQTIVELWPISWICGSRAHYHIPSLRGELILFMKWWK